MSSISVPSPCLVAILLVSQTRSGSGPQLAFSWPQQASRESESQQDVRNDESSGYSSQSSESSSTSADEVTQGSTDESSTYSPRNRKPKSSPAHASVADEAGRSCERKSRTLFGLDEDGLVNLLAPDRSWHKKKFEMSINELTFIGRPIHAQHDGSWQRRRHHRRSKRDIEDQDYEQSTEDEIKSDNKIEQSKETAPNSKSELTMFHVVFVLQTPPLDHNRCVKELYDNVVKRLSRALKVLQSRHDYVWQHVDSFIGNGKHSSDNENESYLHKVESNYLTKALVTIFDAISISKIASVQLMPDIQLPLQIPPITSTSYLPSLTEAPIPPGLWLTTATDAATNVNSSERNFTSASLQLAKSYTLLLRSSPQKIARDVQAGSGPLADHLPRFVAALKPTKSFWKISVENKISLADIQLLARHLIYWRRAILIPPLHQRDTYILSPNADFRKLPEACKNFEQHFPAPVPALPKILSVLSGIPRPYGTIIPSSDHKEIYMYILAWLLRNGFVTQLRTFAYVRVTSDMKKTSAERDRDREASFSQTVNSNEQINQSNENGPSRPSFVSRQSSDGRQSVRDPKGLKLSSLIKSPVRATPEESKWLTSIQNSILEDDGLFGDLDADERQTLSHYWSTFTKYFDGTTALETVFIKEALKRKITWKILGSMGLSFDGGVEKVNGNDTLMVIVRHW